MNVLLGICTAILLTWAGFIFNRDRAQINSLKKQLKVENDQKAISKNLVIPLIVITAIVSEIFLSWCASIVFSLCVAGPWVSSRISIAKKNQQITTELPFVISLFRLAIDCGLNVYMSISVVGQHSYGPIGSELKVASKQIDEGMRVSQALTNVSLRLSSEVSPLIDTLLSAERYGAPISIVLDRLEREGRDAQKRRIERATKRLSVQLLFPLAGCILPAFALLTVTPLIAGSLLMLASSTH